MLKVVNEYQDVSTHRVGEIRLVYQDIVDAIGEPIESDNYKVSGEWIFLDEDSKEVFTLYDWKSTSLYSEHLPSVEEFRANTEAVYFNIGGTGNGDVDAFKQLLLAQISWVKSGGKIAEQVLLGHSTPLISSSK